MGLASHAALETCVLAIQTVRLISISFQLFFSLKEIDFGQQLTMTMCMCWNVSWASCYMCLLSMLLLEFSFTLSAKWNISTAEIKN